MHVNNPNVLHTVHHQVLYHHLLATSCALIPSFLLQQ